MSEEKSYRQILRSSSIIGGASVINILVGLLRIKVVAIVLGPAGVGLIGLLQNLMSTASAISGLGFGSSGTRQIAEAVAHGDDAAVATVRRALFWGALALALAGGVVFWLLREQLASLVLDDPSRSGDLGWIALGVALMVASSSQGALLNGLRRIGDLARVSIVSAVFYTILGVGALLIWRERGVLLFVLAGPAVSFLVSHWYVARLGAVRGPVTPIRDVISQWGLMARLGAAFVVSGLVVLLGQLLVRTLVQHQYGAAALGQFQAAWAISMTYLGFVLTAMGTDYYPRLTAAIHDYAAANRMVNEQSEVALLLAGPVFLTMLGLTPWVIELLYSSAFDDAVVILRWQVMGDVLKVASWPLGFIILAAGDGRTFMVTESLAIGFFVALTWIGLPMLGIKATGVAFFAMYMAYLPMVYWLAHRRTGFRWDNDVLMHLAALSLVAMAVGLAGAWSSIAAAISGVTSVVAFAIYGLARLGTMTNLGGPVGKAASFSQRFLSRMRPRG